MASPIKLDEIPSLGLTASNLKCFREPQGFDEIKPVNVIIGRNNTGKSTLLDLVQYAVSGGVNPGHGHMNRAPEILFSCQIDETIIDRYCDNMSWANGWTFKKYALEFLKGKMFSRPANNDGQCEGHINRLSSEIGFLDRFSLDHTKQVLTKFASGLGNPFSRCYYNRILADRDISIETVGKPAEAPEELRANGENATRLITRYLNEARLDRSIVESTIVKELNDIFHPDARFNRIVPLQRDEGDWEIYLDEPKKGLIPISRAGSGIKTILLVLLNLYLVPDLLPRLNKPKKLLSEFLFGFEELENNLHPSLQRRLFLYLRDFAQREGCKFFITTHSHVVIDLFSRDEKAQIIHVTHDGECARATRIATYIGHRSIFQDLEVRASDLLQTNAVVWVEGPSDRIYFNRWVELWSNGELMEHVDYEVVFTGGSLLAHISFEDQSVENEKVEALRINGNAIILIDSDKKQDESDNLKARVERVASEVEKMGGMAWITEGREVENYIPTSTLNAALDLDGMEPTDKFCNIFQFIKEHGGSDFGKRKTDLAERVCKHLSRDLIAGHLDLGEKLRMVCDKIKVWNNRTIL